jgi:hypothetical protein
MPLPDADKKSPRVYTLSQNTDLENMAFATLQSIGQPINIEEMNEDELRRLVLVNLARLAVKGEWDGLLSAGGGEFNVVLPEDFGDTGYVRYVVNSFPPWGSSTTTSQNFSTSDLYDRPIFYPFIAPESGDIGEVGIEFIVASTSSNDIQVGIYSSTATTGAPDTLLGKAVIDSTSTGAVYDTSLTSTVTLVKGTQYWLAVVRSTTQINVTFRAISGSYNPSMFAYNAPNCNGRATCIRLDSSDLTLPSSGITLTNFIPVNLDTPAVSIKIT